MHPVFPLYLLSYAFLRISTPFLKCNHLCFYLTVCACVRACKIERRSLVSFGKDTEGLEGGCRFDAGAQCSVLAETSHISLALFRERDKERGWGWP